MTPNDCNVTHSGQLQSRPATETSQHVRKFSRQSVCSFCITNKTVCSFPLYLRHGDHFTKPNPQKVYTRHLTQSEALSEITSPVLNLHVEHRRLFSRLCNKQIIKTYQKITFFGYRRRNNRRRGGGVMEANGSGFRRILLLALCVSGIWSAYIYQGVLQETL